MCAATSLVARTGRHRQRYDDDRRRLVAGCIPYRLNQNADRAMALIDRLEVLMISSPNRDDLVFPKGGWENDETIEQAACREALEEAGVSGLIHKRPLGMWEFRSKSRQTSCSLEGICRGYMFALKVTKELDSWPEEACHKRRWVSSNSGAQQKALAYSLFSSSPYEKAYTRESRLSLEPSLCLQLSVQDARDRCRYPWMCEALDKFLASLSTSDPSCYVKPSEPECLDSAVSACVAVAPHEAPKLRDDGALPLNCLDHSVPWLPCKPTATLLPPLQ